MEITWFGHSCFRLVERGMASVVTDPYDESLGYPALRLKADIVTISHLAPGHSNIEAVKGETRALRRPGEYENCGGVITGFPTAKTQAERAQEKKTAGDTKSNTLLR